MSANKASHSNAKSGGGGKKLANADLLTTKRDIVIEDVVSNPIAVGYLLDFCQKSVSW